VKDTSVQRSVKESERSEAQKNASERSEA